VHIVGIINLLFFMDWDYSNNYCILLPTGNGSTQSHLVRAALTV